MSGAPADHLVPLTLLELRKDIIMTEDQETFTRAEVETLLKQLNDDNVQQIREHFEAERAQKLPPVWVAVTIIAMGVITLWAAAFWPFTS